MVFVVVVVVILFWGLLGLLLLFFCVFFGGGDWVWFLWNVAVSAKTYEFNTQFGLFLMLLFLCICTQKTDSINTSWCLFFPHTRIFTIVSRKVIYFKDTERDVKIDTGATICPSSPSSLGSDDDETQPLLEHRHNSATQQGRVRPTGMKSERQHGNQLSSSC